MAAWTLQNLAHDPYNLADVEVMCRLKALPQAGGGPLDGRVRPPFASHASFLLQPRL